MTKKIAVFGLGKSGISAIKAASLINAEVYVVNQGEVSSWPNLNDISELLPINRCFNQTDAVEIFSLMDEIIISPGIPSTHEVLKKAHEKKVKITSEIEFGLQFTKAPVIAITGTNGKTTTTTMIGEMLKNCGLNVFICGNIGTPVCDLATSKMNYDVIVMEVSSFQLETIHDFHPIVSIINNITPNHGERYQSIEDYAAAKFFIAKNLNESDTMILHGENELIKKFAENLKCEKILFNNREAINLIKTMFDLSEFKLVGDHNLLNLYCAATAVLSFGKKRNLETRFGIQKCINEFKGVDHRIEFLGEFSCGKVYNDAKSTNILSTLTAIRAFSDEKRLFLIIGGKKRGLNDSLTAYIPEIKNHVHEVILVGETEDFLAHEFEGQLKFKKCGNFQTAIDYFKSEGQGGVLLLSPSFPSFDQFKNYVDRGNTFKALVHKSLR